MNNPSVFFSYSHDNEAHKKWVLKLATDMRSHGVNAVLDQWDLRLGSDLRFFMENGLSSANLVLCICSEAYVKKVNTGTSGAGYEGMIMTQALLKNANSDYIISIVRNNNSDDKVPKAFGSKLYIDFSDDLQYFTNYQQLLERIYGEDIKKKPPLGMNPFSDTIAKKVEVKNKIESARYHSPEPSGSVVFRFDNNNGNYILGNGEYVFQTHWSRCGNNSIYAVGNIGFSPELTDYPQLEDIINLDFTSRTRTIRTNQIVVYMNEFSHFVAIKLGAVKSSSHGYPYDEMQFDYYIYGLS